ncbi:C-type lectin domain family 4 member E-like [Epargyreus clarus]|uniref:C-type lectin domain family 4 member E-like n=1 Tax=Epargyreus clarus TaxID=520877 RepID=UPI003C2DC072
MRILLCSVLILFRFTVRGTALPEDSLEEKFHTWTPEFRYDYTYHHGIRGWLKLHHVPANFAEAGNRCKYEGGELATPLDLEMLEAMKDTLIGETYQSVFIGVHSIFSYGDYYSIKGVPLGRMPLSWTKWGPSFDIDKRCVVFFQNGTITNDYCNKAGHPYICYKRHENETLSICGTIDKDYMYVPDLDTCYKIHARRTTWRDAFMTCSAEGAHLLVINSEKEMKSVVNLAKPFPRDIQIDLFAGFVDLNKAGQWTTIHGVPLEESGFAIWNTGEPNNSGKTEYCGSFQYSTGYNDELCDKKMGFVCEKKKDSLLPATGKPSRILTDQFIIFKKG